MAPAPTYYKDFHITDPTTAQQWLAYLLHPTNTNILPNKYIHGLDRVIQGVEQDLIGLAMDDMCSMLKTGLDSICPLYKDCRTDAEYGATGPVIAGIRHALGTVVVIKYREATACILPWKMDLRKKRTECNHVWHRRCLGRRFKRAEWLAKKEAADAVLKEAPPLAWVRDTVRKACSAAVSDAIGERDEYRKLRAMLEGCLKT